ncbi:MAG: hypothetical protein H7321_07150 [Bacteroidia bacterium]|nr:hypothetical protein [Bacteroidia bacterium]
MKKSTLILLVLISLLTSCSLTKMRYSNGFRIEWNSGRSIGKLTVRDQKTKKTVVSIINDSNVINHDDPKYLSERDLSDFETVRASVHEHNLTFKPDSDTIVYYKRKKKIRANPYNDTVKLVKDTTHIPADTVRHIKNTNGKYDRFDHNTTDYERNTKAAIIVFFAGLATVYLFTYTLIAATILAKSGRKYFKAHPESNRRGRNWANFIYYFGSVLLYLSIILTVILIVALIALIATGF